ncbi:MAG: hypothetical protein KH029_08955, partial [Haemophilus parainfluenzae]|nr:hypothetical protein [Haemophilus parainfluenzae]MDU3250438.1 ESPR-type extended signal peptide-containing protein [Haemophilus parainfluenzae]
MNNIFKIIWNKTTQRIEVVSELAKGAVKTSSGSHQSKSIAIKSTLKLSLLSLCLGFTNEAMALANIDGKTTFHAPQGGVLTQNRNGKYAVGVYDRESDSFAFGYAQAGLKKENGNEPAAVGRKQLAIGNDNLTSSGWNSIAIGSNSDRKGGSQGMGTIAIGAGMQAIGRNVVAIGTNSGSGGKYNGYDDAVYLGSYSRINNKGQGQTQTDEALKALEKTYTDAVDTYNKSETGDNLNKVIAAGKAINNVALNKVDAMTIKSNSDTNNKFNVTESTITPLNESKDKTTVSILSIGGKDGDNIMYRQIQNVAAGRMSADSFDAVNGSQLYYVRNYTGWNIGHTSGTKDIVTGRVNNDHTVIFKANDNYVNVSTTLDSTNKSTVNIGVNTSDISVTKNNERITAVAANNPTNAVATNTVATATSVRTALNAFNEVKADKNTKFTINAGNQKVKDLTLGNDGTVNFKAEDGLEVESKNDAVVYKLNAESKKSIADAKAAATTVTNKLNEINQSVQRAETAAQTATNKAAEANTAATKAKASENAAATSAKTASNKAAEATAAAGKAKASETAAKASETAAKASETKAKESETNAKASETAAKASETNAKASETAAKASETNAKASETA